jgi:hypothetical protein
MFVYESGARPPAPTAPRFTAHLNPMQEDWSFGFASEQLAATLGVSERELFAANSGRRLTLEQVETNTPGGEGATAKRYTFRIGNKEGSLIVETPMQSGSA